ncbi:GIY-YIG nuclease family protein [Leeuwenhoekiella palythoae]|uniref:Endonuclease n=1 Tax=Leeuwenhoekiella palythoae TaxID=573501 RepID=A0A1M5ZE26_9FLAO|nr:GIY-YIG nuclease family protein [Leeuwenhoekiella palythoae]RXG27980.1 putative endonuclease [Leeuwenhoekiella palythoae]SHI22458.1 putative endonuclease [Leeuwenhoekiella palythoae]
MKHYLYIIYSKDLDKFYTGETSNIQERIIIHNNHAIKTAYTKAASDWKLMLSFPCKDRTEALFLERFIKRMKSKKFIQKIIDDPYLLFNILNKK